MKKLILFTFLLIFAPFTYGQINVYDGSAIANPQTFADGAYKFVATGDNLMQQGRYEEAIMAYDNAIAQNAMLADALVKRALAKYRIGREAEAKQDMQIANALNPFAGDLHGFGGTAKRLNLLAFNPMELIEQPNTDYILEYYKKIWDTETVDLSELDITPQGINDMSEKEAIAQITTWIDLKEFDKAETALLSLNEKKAIHYDFLGILKKLNQQWESAYHYFEKATKTSPTNAPSYYFMSLIKTHEKDYTTALELIEKALLYNPEMLKAHFHKAVLYKVLEKPEQALSTYEFLTESDNYLEFETHINLAITKKILGDPTGALYHIKEAFELQDQDEVRPELFTIRGNIYMLINNYSMAIEDYNRAIELDNSYAEAYFNRALAQILAFNRADACYDLQKSVELGYFKGKEKLKYFCVF